MILIKTESEIARMRASGRITARVLEALREAVRPGVTTAQLDALAERIIRSENALPAFKGYNGFPGSICASVNDQVVHGIPGPRRLNEGDLLKIDTGAILDGWYSDAAITCPVGKVSAEALGLIEVTRECFYKGVAAIDVKGGRVSDISHAVQSHAQANGCSVVRALCGHGIGLSMHEDPEVANYVTPRRGPRFRPGMVLAIEPMLNLGGWDVRFLDDGWTVVTADGSLSGHYEHTVALTEDGVLILTEL